MFIEKIKETVGVSVISILVIIMIVAQLIGYYVAYAENGLFNATGEIILMTIFPPYAWYAALEILGVFRVSSFW